MARLPVIIMMLKDSIECKKIFLQQVDNRREEIEFTPMHRGIAKRIGRWTGWTG